MSVLSEEGGIIDNKIEAIITTNEISSPIDKATVQNDKRLIDNELLNQIDKAVDKISDKQLEIKSDVNSNLNSVVNNDVKSVDKVVDDKQIDDNDANSTAHKNELSESTTTNKPIITDSTDTNSMASNNASTSLDMDLNSDGVYIVEALLKSKVRKVKGVENKLYLVKWKGYTNKYNTWEPAENILDERLISNFEEQEKAKPPKTPRQAKTKPTQEETPDSKPTKPAGRKPPMNRESIVSTPSRRSRRSTKSSDDTRDDVKDDDKEIMEVVETKTETKVDAAKSEKKIESNGTVDKPIVETAQNELVKNDQIKNDNQKSSAAVDTTPEKLSTNSQDKKTTIEKVISLTDKLLTPEKSNSTNLDEHQTNGQTSKLSIDNDMQIDKLDVCLNGDSSVKRKANEIELDSINEPSKKILKTSDDLVKSSNGLI